MRNEMLSHSIHEVAYYEELKIAHLFDTMHIWKNVTETLWQIIDGRREKDKIVKICTDI